MLVEVQNRYKAECLASLDQFDGTSRFFSVLDPAADNKTPPDLIIGDLSYLENFVENPIQKILVTGSVPIADHDLHRISRLANLFIVENADRQQLVPVLNSIKNDSEKKQQVQFIKAEIQKKRKNLEFLNNQLSSESARKIESLEKSHIEETEKNQNEKKSN